MRVGGICSRCTAVRIIDKLCAEFIAVAPSQLTSTGLARREYDRELSGHLVIFCDHLHAGLRYVRDHAISGQRAVLKLDLRELLACKPFASTSIYQAPASIFHHVSVPRRFIHDFQTFWRKIVGICLRNFSKNVLIHLRSVYRVSPMQREPAPTLRALLRGRGDEFRLGA